MNVHPGDMQRDLPGNMDAEQALLGAVLLNNDAFDVVSSIIEPKHFREDLHSKIFEATSGLIARGQIANTVTVKSLIPEEKIVEGLTTSQYLARLATHAVNILNAPDYAQRVLIEYQRRQAIIIGNHLMDAGFDLSNEVQLLEEVDALRTALDQTIADLSGKEQRSGVDIASDYLTAISKDTDARDGEGVPVCLSEIGKVLSDTVFRPKRLYGLLSSSGEGKTSLTLQQINHALTCGHPVLFLSYDQSWHECVAQMAAQELGIELRRQMQKDLSDKEREDCYSFSLELGAKPFEVIECTNETASRLAGYAKTWFKKARRKSNKTPFIVVDHIGTVTPENKQADEGTKARQIAQEFKSLAKALNAAVLVLQQRSSAGMKRLNPRPIVYDLYGGQAALQPFDAVMYLFRAEKYRNEQMATASNQAEYGKIDDRFPMDKWGEKAEIGALKVRFGDPSFRPKVEWESRFTRYRSLQDDIQEGLPL
ncbi:replicative DNA helicase [Hoeflea sp. TYP-13]|uniref:replicative DNA helicase n=1 Tax=Hoeflea sp. TYP-13 TaxID=3230023 RepID=UPI0034C67AA1